MKNTFYITSPIFYPNANLHIGHAYTMTLADAFARYHKLKNEDVFFLTGTDENTAKVIKAAAEKDQSIEEYLRGITTTFKDLYANLEIHYDQFIQTTDRDLHWPGAIEMWKRLDAAGDIYKGSYEGLYCPSCEAFYTEKDLIEGKCPYHGTVPEKIKEENYFFNLSKYTGVIKEKIVSGEYKIIPESRKNEILALLDRGLEDISFSRPAKTVPHAIPVPGDPSQVIYVWCDALVNYISALGFGANTSEKYSKFWPANVHVIGKDILRFHAAIWPAMLLSAKIPLPRLLLVHGFITSGGKKMSKSLGNVIDPNELISSYGEEALRYFLLREISPFEDGDITMDGLKNAYNANLANGLGNLVSRIMKLASTHLEKAPTLSDSAFPADFVTALDAYEIQKATNIVWEHISNLDSFIQSERPFEVVKTDKEKGKEIIETMVIRLYIIGEMLAPILPETSVTIKNLVKENKMPEKPLFLRKD